MGKQFIYLLLLIFATQSKSLAQQSTTSVWTVKYKTMVYNMLYKQADSLYKYDSDKKAFADCGLKKLIIALPKGLNNDPKINFREVGSVIGKSCALEIKGTPKSKYLWVWSPETEASFKNVLMNSDLKAVSEPLRSKVCNCIVQKMKEMYPSGVPNPFPTETVSKITEICTSDL